MFNKKSLLGLLLIVGAIALFHFTVIVRPKEQQEKPKGRVTLVNFVKNMDVSPHEGKLCVTFFTQNPTRCRLGVGFSPRRQSFKVSNDEWFGRQHILSVDGLSPGIVYFAISGEDENGNIYKEPVHSTILPKRPLVIAKSPKETKVEQRTAGVETKTGGKASSAKPSLVSTSITLAQGKKPVTGSVEMGLPTTTSTHGSTTTTLALVTLQDNGQMPPEVSSEEGDDEEDPFNKLPNADPSTELGQRALSASKIDRSFGPGSLEAKRRKEIIDRIETLRKEYEDYDDVQGARQLAQAYLELRDYRKALQFASAGVRHCPKDVGSHKIRLTVYKKFAMGWKVRETYQKLVALCPSDAGLKKGYSRDSQLFGNFKTIGKAQRVEIK